VAVETVWRFIWAGTDDVRCQIEVEIVGDHRTSRTFSAIVRRLYYDGLVPLVQSDGRLAEFTENSKENALARAKLFLDRRFGFGNVGKPEKTTENMRIFPSQRLPEKITIAGYRRFGCPVCRIGEPNEELFAYWIEHAAREHGYQVVSDTREPAPRLRNVEKLFRVVKLARQASADHPSARRTGAGESLPRMMPRKPTRS
jgi:hypothetical protein